jgi:hypothetical protein
MIQLLFVCLWQRVILAMEGKNVMPMDESFLDNQ